MTWALVWDFVVVAAWMWGAACLMVGFLCYLGGGPEALRATKTCVKWGWPAWAVLIAKYWL